MNNTETELVAKPVKDMYGTPMGTILGTITDIDGSIQTVGIDCGSAGLLQVPFEQLVAQGDVVVFVPKWRLDSQRLIREKGLVLRRLKALLGIVAEDDEMKQDAEVIHGRYRDRLASLEESERSISAVLESRLSELDLQMKAAKTVVFDAKVQFRSGEIGEDAFERVRRQSEALVDHIVHERAEIANVQRRMADLDMEIKDATSEPQVHESAAGYLGEAPSAPLPEAPTGEPEAPAQDWLSRMEAQQA